MRRRTLISVLLGALVGLAVATGISLAGSGGSSSGSSSGANEKGNTSGQGSFASAYAKKGQQRNGQRGGRRGGRGHGHHGPLGFGVMGIAFNGFADKLGVESKELHEAFRGVKKRALDRAVADKTITADERAALDTCMKSRRRGSGCDRKQARAAHRKLHRAMKARARSDAAGLKAQFLGDLATELGKQPAEVETAARETLVEMLDKGVTMGFVTERGRELALGCFDKPNECDRAALRAEVKKRFRGRGGRGHHGGPHGRP